MINADNIYEEKIIRFNVKSPIHVGGVEQRLTPFEYIQSERYVYPVSHEKLSLFLHEKRIIEAYVRDVNLKKHKFRLLEFFKNNGINLTEKDFEKISGGRKIRLIGKGLQDYRPFIRDGYGIPYIPGSSIKGVIRTAILYNALLEYKNRDPEGFKKNIIEPIQQANRSNLKKGDVFKNIEREWLKNFVLSDKKRSSNTDWLRILHVSDAYPVNTTKTILIPMNILKKEGSGWNYKLESPNQNTTIWVESISPNTVIEFKVLWDKKLLNDFQSNNRNINLPQSLAEVLSNIKKWANDVFAFEKEFTGTHALGNWYKSNSASFRVGFGSGMISTTLALLLPEELRKMIRNFVGKNKGDDIAPKSRRIWLNNNQPVPLGWAMLEVLPFNLKEPLYSEQENISSTIDTFEQQITEQDINQTTQPVEKKEPEKRTIPNVTLTYNPGNRLLSTTVEGKKAFIDHIDDNFIPEELWPKLKKDKRIKGSIVVEPMGNAFKIVEFIKQE